MSVSTSPQESNTAGSLGVTFGKQVGIGAVPIDWDTLTLDELEQRGDIRLFRGKVISQKDIDRLPGDYPIYSSSVHCNGLFGRYGAYMFDEELITWSVDGGGHFFHRPRHRFSVTNVCGYLRVRTSSIDYRYLAYQLQHLHSRKVFDYTLKAHPSVIRGSYTVALPSIEEQRAIAEALSDVDGLLGALEALITKKRAIKQAAMQQLLAGKTRLPGFSGEWDTKRIGDISTFLPTANNPRADLGEYGEVEYIHYGDIHAHAQPVMNCALANLPRIDKSRVGNAAQLQDGDLVMVDASEDLVGVGKSVEVQGLAGRAVVGGLHTILCRGNHGHWAIGFKAYLQFIPAFRSALTRMASGISVYAISKNQLADVELALPPAPEQEAIVAVLSDMDAEIAALERRRDKTRAIKQGLMEQLLTGRVRLVKPPQGEASA